MADSGESRHGLLWAIGLFGLVLAAGVLLEVAGERRLIGDARAEAIEHGCAQYSPTTGEFEWKGDETK